MENLPMVRQMIIVTDGCSNLGGDPILAAREARALGITVNAIGIIDGGQIGQKAVQEVRAIAEAGEGVYDLIPLRDLAKSMQRVAHRSLQLTLEREVKVQLYQMIGAENVDALHGEKRGKVLGLIEQLHETVNLRCVVLLDISSSMAKKLDIARTSILELINFLHARRGKSEVAILAFPGINGAVTRKIADFMTTRGAIEANLEILAARGGTPTAAAIQEAGRMFGQAEHPCLV